MEIFISLVVTLMMIFFIQTALKNALVPSNLGMDQDRFIYKQRLGTGISTQSTHRETFIEPLPFIGSLESSKEILHSVCVSLGKYQVINSYQNYEHLVFTSSFLRWNDDVELYFDDVLRRIHVNGISRVGFNGRKRQLARYQKIKSEYLNRQ